MDKLRSYKDKLFREFENDKRILKLSPLTRANILPVFYDMIEQAYKKGMKRTKNDIIETINKL